MPRLTLDDEYCLDKDNLQIGKKTMFLLLQTKGADASLKLLPEEGNKKLCNMTVTLVVAYLVWQDTYGE